MRVLIFAGLLKAVLETSHPLFRGVGRPNVEFFIKLTQVILMMVSIYPLTLLWGMQGAAWSVLISFSLLVPFWLIFSMRITGLHLSDYTRVAVPSFVAVLPMAICMQLLAPLWSTGLLPFLAIGSISSLLYLLFVYLLWRLFGAGPCQRVILMIRQAL
jgi:O-antigen/teichoic acid export membrane protein